MRMREIVRKMNINAVLCSRYYYYHALHVEAQTHLELHGAFIYNAVYFYNSNFKRRIISWNEEMCFVNKRTGDCVKAQESEID